MKANSGEGQGRAARGGQPAADSVRAGASSGRVYLLRGLAYERLGEPDRASRKFKEVVVAMQGAAETKSEAAIDPPVGPSSTGIR